MTRIVTVIGALAAATLLGGWAFDRQGPYCLFDREFTNCGYPSIEACTAAARGVPMIGACNGFQVMVQCGLLPGPVGGQGGDGAGDTPPPQRVSLTDNQDARFCDRWGGVDFNPRSVCVWTKGLTDFP